jgi:hypothetical protein
MKNLTNIKDYITSLTNSELKEVKEAIDLELSLSERCIEEGHEERK